MTERKTIIQSTTSGEEIAGVFIGLYLNSYDWIHSSFIAAMAKENPALQYNFTLLCIQWFLALSRVNYYDDRNRASYEIACKMAVSCKFDGFTLRRMKPSELPSPYEAVFNDGSAVESVVAAFLTFASGSEEGNDEYERFLQKMLDEHKTLQQNFARLSFEWFQYVVDNNPNSGAAHVRLAKKVLPYKEPLPFI